MASRQGVLVDADSTGRHLVAAFARRGIALLHLRGSAEPSTAPSDAVFTEHLTVGPTTEVDLKERAPLFVVAGRRSAAPLADQLGEALGLRTNGAAGSAVRGDRRLMTDTLRAAGLRVAEHLRTTDADAAVAWATARGHWPCVVDSADSSGVVVCRNPTDLRGAIRPRTEVLVRSFLSGTEYAVDTVSVDGAAFVCGVWRCEKRTLGTGRVIPNRDLLVSEQDPVVSALSVHARVALAALGVRNGPAHTKAIVGPHGPAILAVDVRLNPNLHPETHQRSLGHDQADLTALAHACPAEFLARYADGCYERLAHATVYNAPTRRDGIVTRVNHGVIDAIRRGAAVVELETRVGLGDRIVPTVDPLTSPLRVFLAAGEGAVEADYRFVEAVRDRVFDVA